MATIKENKGKEVVDEVVRQGETQPRPSVGEKRKSISKGVDLRKQEEGEKGQAQVVQSCGGSDHFSCASHP